MKLEIGNVQKPVRKFRQSLKNLPKNPPIEDVHNLRTHARRIDAVVAAVMPENKKLTRQLQKSIRPVRKAAGQVRDLDVLVDRTLTLAPHGRHPAVMRLLKHLRELRTECAHELLDTIAEQRKEARRTLKRVCRQIEKRIQERNPGATFDAAVEAPNGDAAFKLMEELCRWPTLNASNLHAFRIKIKELRYVLQLASDADPRFVNALGKLKEQIGDWHDWHELAGMAEDALDQHKDRATLNKIDQIEKKKLSQALNAARAVSAKYLTRRKPPATAKTPSTLARSA